MMLQMYLAVLDDPRLEREFTEFYEANVSLALRLAKNRLPGHKDKAEDAVQNAFVDLAKQFSTFHRKSKEDQMAYFAVIVRNKAVDLYRKECRYTDLEEDDRVPDEKTPDKSVLEAEGYHVLTGLIRKLPPSDREILERSCVLEQSADEIAEAMGLKKPALYTRLSRAKAKLKQELEKEGIKL